LKSLILNTSDIIGGAARAAFRLHKGLCGIGVDSKMFVQAKDSDDNNVVGPNSKLSKGFALIRPTLDSLPLSLYPQRDRVIFSPAILPDRLPNVLNRLVPDLVHLHWVAEGFMRIESLGKFRKPIVWTLHDSWAFTGGCHIPFDCNRYTDSCGLCPTLASSRENDLSRKVWARKKRAWKTLDLTIVAPSRWLGECARASSLLRDFPIEIIPNGLNLDCFKPVDKKVAREILALPEGKKLILFGAMDSTTDYNKGFHLLSPTLQKLLRDGQSDEVELVVFGASEPVNPPDFGLKAHYMGRLHDEVALALLYSAADFFVLPSIQENLPNTVMESLACGTPVVAFNVGGVPDMVEHKKTGYLAKPFDTEDLARGIDWILEESGRTENLGRAAREKAVKEYSLELQAERYIKLYKEILQEG
jgi:glycosyltransferase involved in cell wall biosynthesis